MTQSRLYILVAMAVVCTSCDLLQSKQRTTNNSTPKIAVVNGHILHKDKLESQLPIFEDSKDSIGFANALVQEWVVSQLLFDKAQAQVDNQSIDKKVEDYRQELYVHDFEQKLLADATIGKYNTAEIEKFYQDFKNQDLLSEDILKVNIIILSDEVEKLSKFEQGWRRNNQKIIESYLPLAAFMQFDTSKWYSKSQVLQILPDGFPEAKISEKGYRKSKIDEHYCYVQTTRIIKKGNPPPLAYATSKIKKILEYQKQRDFLKRYKEDIYNEALRLKRVEIY